MLSFPFFFWSLWVLPTCVSRCLRKWKLIRKKAKYVISWLLLSVITKMKVRESAGSDFDARPSSDFGQSYLWPLVSKPLSKGKIMWGQWSVPLRLWSPGWWYAWREDKIKKLLNPRGVMWRSYFILKITSPTSWRIFTKMDWEGDNLEAIYLLLNATEWKNMFGFTQDAQLTMEQPYCQICLPWTIQ